MVRAIISGLVGGILMFGWGCVSWLVLDLHVSTLDSFPNEKAVVAALRAHVPESGLYWFPKMSREGNAEEIARESERYREGATGMLLYHAEGMETVTGTMILRGLGLHVVAALIASWMVWLTRASANTVFKRLGLALLLGLFVVATTDLTLWNWLRYPTDYSFVNAVGHMVGILLMGIPIAVMVKEERA